MSGATQYNGLSQDHLLHTVMQVLDSLGGGIRGQFRISRAATPAAGAAQRQASPAPAPTAAPANSAVSRQPVEAPSSASHGPVAVSAAEPSVQGSQRPAGDESLQIAGLALLMDGWSCNGLCTCNTFGGSVPPSAVGRGK